MGRSNICLGNSMSKCSFFICMLLADKELQFSKSQVFMYCCRFNFFLCLTSAVWQKMCEWRMVYRLLVIVTSELDEIFPLTQILIYKFFFISVVPVHFAFDLTTSSFESCKVERFTR